MYKYVFLYKIFYFFILFLISKYVSSYYSEHFLLKIQNNLCKKIDQFSVIFG